MLQKALHLLQQHFGYKSLEPVNNNHSQHIEWKDTVCIMPTGGGKSICFQIPALLLQRLPGDFSFNFLVKIR